jgi:hypothetical protein
MMSPFRDRLICGLSAVNAVVLLSACASVPARQSPSAELGERAVRMFASDCAQLRMKLDSLDQAINGLVAEGRQLPWENLDLAERKALWEKAAYYERYIEPELKRALKDDPKCEIPYLRLGDKAAASVHFSDVEAAVAETYYQYGLSMRPYHPGLLARAAWMRELNGDVDSARALYEQAGLVKELGIDGNREVARLALRDGFLERFKAAGDEAYVELETKTYERQRRESDWGDKDTNYVRLYGSGRCQYSIPQWGRGVFVKGSRTLPDRVRDSVLHLLGYGDMLRFRNILDSTGNHYIYGDVTHSPTTIISVHMQDFEHVFAVYALSVEYRGDRHRYGPKLGLAERLNSLARASKLLSSVEWTTGQLDSSYGPHRPLHSRDGLARYDTTTGMVTGVRLPDFGVAWRTTPDIVPTAANSSGNSVYVFDFGTRVVGFAESDGSVVYSVPMDRGEWPYLNAPPYRDALYFTQTHDSGAIVQVYNATNGSLMLVGEVAATGEVELTNEAIEMGRWERASQLYYMSSAAAEHLSEGKGNRPAMEELDYEHW